MGVKFKYISSTLSSCSRPLPQLIITDAEGIFVSINDLVETERENPLPVEIVESRTSFFTDDRIRPTASTVVFWENIEFRFELFSMSSRSTASSAGYSAAIRHSPRAARVAVHQRRRTGKTKKTGALKTRSRRFSGRRLSTVSYVPT